MLYDVRIYKRYCPNCGTLHNGENRDDRICFKCPVCSMASVIKQKSRRTFDVEEHIPKDSTLYESEEYYLPEE